MYLQMHFKCTEIYEIESIYFLSAPALAWKAALRKTAVELGLLTDIDVINGRRRNSRRNMPCNTYTCKRQITNT